MKAPPDAAFIAKSHELIRDYIHKTPVLTSQTMNERSGQELFFKCENFQKGGAFKIRGATNMILRLDKEEATKGVATHSSGNHAQAVALAARTRGLSAHIIMPENASPVKIAAVRDYGAKVLLCEPTLQAREAMLQDVVEKTGATFIPPYNHYHIIAGQATAAVELLEEVPDLDVLLAPVGGGGLLSGTALAAKYFSKVTQVVGAEPSGADDAFRSLEAGLLIPQENPTTIADGLRTSLGTLNFPIIVQHVDRILTVDDEEIMAAMKLVWSRMKIIIEPSAAVPLAALLGTRELGEKKRIGVILSGGNVEAGVFSMR